MDKIMKIAYFTPLTPVKSGIADFAEELLPYLMQEMEIDIYTENVTKRNKEIFNGSVFKMKNYGRNYDLNVFQIGNNIIHKKIISMFLEIGGIIELHDVSLQHLLLQITRNKREKYIEIMEYCHGEAGKVYAELFVQGAVTAACENHCLDYPVCKTLIDRAQGVIVHSDFAKQMIKGMNCGCKVMHIPLHSFCDAEVSKQNYQSARRELGIDQNTFMIGSFGLVTREKRVEKVIEALSYLRDNYNLKYKYYIVGQLSDEGLLDKINKLGADENVVICGYVESGKLVKYIHACDLCVNLRYPTQGESSASLQRLLGAGKITLVSDIGAFKEFPDDIVKKVSLENEVEDLIYHILEVYFMPEREKMEKSILEYAKKNFDIRNNAHLYSMFFQQIINGQFQEEDMDKILDDHYLKFGNYTSLIGIEKGN